jgi:hypothetical protein
MAGGSHVCVAEHVVMRHVANEMVLLDLATDQYFALNEVGTRMWALLSLGHTVESATSSLLQEFEVAPQHLQADIDWFISRIVDLGLVTRS